MSKGRRPIEILLVEDSPGDARLTAEALKHSKIINNLHVARDGREAMKFLRREGKAADAPRPDLILLDLNLPRMDGREVLESIKNDDDLKMIPVVIMTTSRDEKDVKASYAAHANCYIRKPLDVSGFFDVVNSIENFWFEMVVLPTDL